MTTFNAHQLRLARGALLAAAGLTLVLYPLLSHAANKDVSISFRPPCGQEIVYEDGLFGPIPKVDGMVQLGTGRCPNQFTARDPSTLEIDPQRLGDEFAFDIFLSNPSKQPIERARAWLQYDPNVLEGVSIQLSQFFPDATPGETDFDPIRGFAMIEGAARDALKNAIDPLPFARVKFRVKATPENGTPISFHDVQPGGHTSVSLTEGGILQELLDTLPGSLFVPFLQDEDSGDGNGDGDDNGNGGGNGDGSGGGNGDGNGNGDDGSGGGNVGIGGRCSEDSDCVSNKCVVGICIPSGAGDGGNGGNTGGGNGNGSGTDPLGGGSASSTPSSGGNGPGGQNGNGPSGNGGENSTGRLQRTAFSLLQVRNLRATTEGSSLFLAWDPLNSPDLKAYNVYYGTTSGRYIQRKTIGKDLSSVILRNLPLDTKYFLAVRAVSNADEESAFSQEVTIVVGDPDSSSAPLRPGQDDTVAPENPFAGMLPDLGNPGDLGGNGSGSGDEFAVPGDTGAGTTMTIILIMTAIVGSVLAFRRQSIVLPRSR